MIRGHDRQHVTVQPRAGTTGDSRAARRVLRDHATPTDQDETKTAEELDEEATVRNPDETTRREALELELEDEGRSDLGEEIGDEMP